MNVNLRPGEFLLKSKLNPKSSAGETVGLKKNDLVEIEKLKNEKKRKELGKLKASNSRLYDVKLEEKVFRNRDCVDYLKNEVAKSAMRMMHVKSGVAITDAIYRVEEQKPLAEIRSQFLPKLEKAKSTKAFRKKLSVQEKPDPISLHMKSDLRIASTIEASGVESILQTAPFFVTQPPVEHQDSLYENLGHHSLFDNPDKI